MSGLRLYVFGPPRLEHEGVVVEIGRRKALAILIYLAVTRQRHGRDVLATLLWPDYDQRQARAALRRDLAALNTSLPGAWLHADRESIGLVGFGGPMAAPATEHRQDEGSDLWLDIDQFHDLLAACEGHGHPAQEVCPACLMPLTKAVGLYRDDFLAGFTLRDCPGFDDWQLFQTERLRQELATTLARLIQAHTAHGQIEPAIQHARRWVALDPLHEPAHRCLMQLYAAAGQPVAALRQYEECARVLAEELGVSPSEETSELHKTLQGKLAHPQPGQQLMPSLPRLPSFLERAASVEPAQPVFVARECELSQLDRFLELALSGQGRMAFVVGESGSGKTALVQEFARRAQAAQPGLIVAGGACQAFTGVGDPYLPFREILSLLTGDVEARWAAGAISQQQALNLWFLLPQAVQTLCDDGPDLVDTFVPGAALVRRAEADAPVGAGWLAQLKELVAGLDARQASPNVKSL